jgi:hypothetical protein
MTELEKAARQALDALSGVADWVNLRTREHPWDQYQRVEPAITALRTALQQAEPVSALTRYTEIAEDAETYTGTALERLRIFCSVAMTEEDWLDAEPFFDAAEAELTKLDVCLAEIDRLKQQAEPVDFDRQVRDISAGIGLPSVESPIVPDPVIDCDCGRRWCWTDDAGWNAKQAEPVVESEETYKAVPMKTVRTGVVTWEKQAEPVPPWYRQFCNCLKCSEAPKQVEPVKGESK